MAGSLRNFSYGVETETEKDRQEGLIDSLIIEELRVFADVISEYKLRPPFEPRVVRGRHYVFNVAVPVLRPQLFHEYMQVFQGAHVRLFEALTVLQKPLHHRYQVCLRDLWPEDIRQLMY